LIKIELIKGDITQLSVDAIVNAANSTLLGGGGVDGAIHRAAGKQLVEECRTLGGCQTGEAKITKGYNLPAKHVIHTVGPIYQHYDDDTQNQLLSNCYINSLLLAEKYQLKTIAFPNISTGVYRFPKQQAAYIAINSVKNFEFKSIQKVIFVCFDDENYNIYSQLLNI
jgi:O-acetyl-ADP-ribose deacetylase (regulator of RNase III)